MLRSLKDDLNRLGDRELPVFGQFSLWVMLACCMYLVYNLDIGYIGNEKGETVSVFGMVASEPLLSDQTFFDLCRVAFFVAAIAWCLRIGTPVTGWLTLIFYTIVVSIYWENLPWFRHKYIIPNWLLFVYAMWYQFYRVEIRTATRERNFWTTRCCPYWVFLLSVYCVAIFYTMSGWSKVLASGLGWGDGTSLQIWTWWNGAEDSFVTQMVVNNGRLATFLQSGALILESLAFCALFSRRIAVTICLGFLAFHASVDLAFGIDFRTNAVLLSVYLLPTYEFCRHHSKCLGETESSLEHEVAT